MVQQQPPSSSGPGSTGTTPRGIEVALTPPHHKLKELNTFRRLLFIR